MGFTEDFAAAVTTLESQGHKAIRVDLLAAILNITPKPGQLAGETLADKVKMFRELEEMGEASFPFELVSHRERKSAGVDFEGVVYKESPLMAGDKPKLNKDGTPAMQRYYWPAVVRRSLAKEKGISAIKDFAVTVNNMGIPNFEVGVTSDGLTLTVRYVLPSVEAEASATPLRSVA